MRLFATLLMSACLAAAGTAAAQDAKKEAMPKPMTMQECKDHMAAMAKNQGAKKDDAMMKKDAMCAEMMKKEAATTKDAPKK